MTSDLPRALCRVCGSVVPEGKGTRLDDGWATSESRANLASEQRRTKHPLDEWRRAHDECAAMALGDVIGHLTGRRVSDPVARDVLRRTRVPSSARQAYGGPNGAPPSGKAWGWVSKHDTVRLIRAVEAAQDARRPAKCLSGACAMCGVAESIAWRETDLVWRHGGLAPICDACTVVWDRRNGISGSTDPLKVRLVALEAFSGFADLGDFDGGLKPFYELADEREAREGYERPWTYRPALAEVRQRVYAAAPRLAPDDIREVIEAAQRAAITERAERDSVERDPLDWSAVRA